MEKQTKRGKRDFLLEAKSIQAELLESIQGINLEDKDKAAQKERINLMYKMRAGINAAKYSGDRDIEITISSSNNIKELIEVAKKLSGVMEYFLTQTTYLTKKGDTDGAIELIKSQALFQDSISQHVKDLDEVVSKYLIDGVGRRGDVKAAQEAEHARKVNLVKEVFSNGVKISEIVKTSGFTKEQIESICQNLKPTYLNANKSEIVKALGKGKNFLEVAQTYEVKAKLLKGIVLEWAKEDEKLAKIVENLDSNNASKAEPVTA